MVYHKVILSVTYQHLSLPLTFSKSWVETVIFETFRCSEVGLHAGCMWIALVLLLSGWAAGSLAGLLCNVYISIHVFIYISFWIMQRASCSTTGGSVCLGQRLRRRLPPPHVGLFVDLLLGNLRWQCVLLLEKLWSVLMLRMFCLIEKKSPLAGVHERSWKRVFKWPVSDQTKRRFIFKTSHTGVGLSCNDAQRKRKRWERGGRGKKERDKERKHRRQRVKTTSGGMQAEQCQRLNNSTK